MSSDRLHEAARVLRERAEAAPPGPWSVVPGASNVWHFPDEGAPTLVASGTGAARVQRRATEARLSDADFIATMHPGVGLALADWLDAEADERRWGRLRDFDAVGISDRIADLILGGTP